MARFYFNVIGDEISFDEIGSEYDSMRDVHAAMISRATHIAIESGCLLQGVEGWEVEALDEKGKIVATLNFGLEKL